MVPKMFEPLNFGYSSLRSTVPKNSINGPSLSHVPEDTFSHGAAHFIWRNCHGLKLVRQEYIKIRIFLFLEKTKNYRWYVCSTEAPRTSTSNEYPQYIFCGDMRKCLFKVAYRMMWLRNIHFIHRHVNTMC